ncbi:hypothetical protein FBU59_000926 [Linderina macrospora]|uniref:Uncharacterized protein n=1 Tax=Linderina macrospora TaxID=4868 RepID=A0ACC1JFA0_9FUNG|nr:hypothetical protein FBU59_000926 [Linderina macrospora]
MTQGFKRAFTPLKHLAGGKRRSQMVSMPTGLSKRTETQSSGVSETTGTRVREMIEELLDMSDRVDCGLVDASQVRRRLGIGRRRLEQCDIYYEVFGSGPKRLLLIMGMLGNTMYWRLQTRYFAHLGDYTVCVFDNRGSGRTSMVNGPYKISQMAKDALLVMEHIGWKDDIHVVGVSMGGMIAQELCLMNSEEEECAGTPKYASVTLVDTWHSSSMALPTAKEVKFAFNGMAALGEDPKHLIDLVFSRDWAQAPFRDPLDCDNSGNGGVTNRQVLKELFTRIEMELAEFRGKVGRGDMTPASTFTVTPSGTASPAHRKLTVKSATQVPSEPPTTQATKQPPAFKHTQSSPVMSTTVPMNRIGGAQSSLPMHSPSISESSPVSTDTASKRETAGDMHQFMACLGHRLTQARVRSLRKLNPQTRFLVVHGRKDRVIRPVSGRTLAKLIGCPIVWLEGAGHMPLIDAHCTFNLVVRAFTRNEPWLDELPDRTSIAPAPWDEQVKVRQWMGDGPAKEITVNTGDNALEQVRLACWSNSVSPVASPVVSPRCDRRSKIGRIEPVGDLAHELIFVDDHDAAQGAQIVGTHDAAEEGSRGFVIYGSLLDAPLRIRRYSAAT